MVRSGRCVPCRRVYTWSERIPLAEAGCLRCWGPLEADEGIATEACSQAGKPFMRVPVKMAVQRVMTIEVIEAGRQRERMAACSRERRQGIRQHDRAVVRRNEPRRRRYEQ